MRWSGLVLVLGSCGFPALPALNDASTGDDAGSGEGLIEVARVPAVGNPDVDMLFVIDDSPAMLDKQTNLTNAFPAFLGELNLVAGGLPNLHIGVVTSDLGTKGAEDAAAGPSIGAGPGACSGMGKAGAMQVNAAVINGPFISDTRGTGSSRNLNYTGSLSSAFASIASVGATGCGFEQHLQAIKNALNNNPANTGFLRTNAGLAVIVLADEDDCSMAHSSLLGGDTSLGPLQSFRCTRFGITCQTGGTTSDDMNNVGVKGQCQSNENSAYLTRVRDYATYLKSIKPDPTSVMFAALVAPATPFEVVLRVPGGGGSPVPALANSCSYTGANGTELADPAVRIHELATQFVRNTTSTVCAADLSPQLVDIARHVRGLTGDACLMNEIAKPSDCVVTDEVGSMTTPLPPCSATVTMDCYQLVSDPANCTTPSHLKLDVVRSAAAPPNTVTIASCRL